MIFYAYLALMGVSVGLSLFNLRRGDIRLTGLAASYLGVVAGFHWIIWHFNIQKTDEFPLFVAGAQGVISFIAYEIGCRAAKIIMPFAWFAILFNCLIFIIGDYPSLLYFYISNVIQCAQIASLIFASTLWHGYAYSHKKAARDFDNSLKRMSYEREG